MSKTNFSMPVVFVEDIEISKNFYQDIFALEIENNFGENIVFKNSFSIWQKNRAMTIIFGHEIIKEKINNINNIELYFETVDLESIWEKVKSSEIDIIHPIKEESWGQRVFRIYDPDRFIIEVAEPMAEVIKRLHKMGFLEEIISAKTQMPLKTVKDILGI